MGKLFKSQKASLLKCNDGRADYKVWANSTIEYTKYPIKKKLQLCLWRGMGFAVNVTLILTALFQFCHPSWSFHLSSSEMLFKNLVNHPSKKCFAWTDLCSTWVSISNVANMGMWHPAEIRNHRLELVHLWFWYGHWTCPLVPCLEETVSWQCGKRKWGGVCGWVKRAESCSCLQAPQYCLPTTNYEITAILCSHMSLIMSLCR